MTLASATRKTTFQPQSRKPMTAATTPARTTAPVAALRIADLEKTPNGSVYVLNNTKGDDRAKIILTIARLAGDGFDTVEIPVTYLPIELTGQVQKKQLLASAQFRRAISSGFLKLVHEDAAVRALDKPGAQAEVQRLMRESRQAVSASAALTTGADAPDAQASNLSARVQQFMVTLEESKDVTPTLNTLRSMGELIEEEYRAIISAADGKKGFEELIEFCEESIEGLGA
jgi:hypothetical protein